MGEAGIDQSRKEYVRPMSQSELAIAGFYDHEQEDDRAPDWGSDDVFTRSAEGRYMEPVPVGRRTVTITGRPERVGVPRRPSRTIDERIAHRPERVASWTCAMGFLMILLAVITSH
jgi:hypothetical protein